MSTLKLDNLGKCYRYYPTPGGRLVELLTGRQRHHPMWALRGVSLELAEGDCLGLIGDNGAGKSTLLKLITGTLQPTEGQVVKDGRLTAILELGAGFHPDFTGRENLYFSASLMGLSRSVIAAREAAIIEFAELEASIDQPVKTFSSGMMVRLAFSLVTSVEPDILIIDEALAVGDQHFQKKCVERIDEFRGRGCIILFCSHGAYHIRQLCNRAIWIDHGAVAAMGSTSHVLGAYEDHVREVDAERATPAQATDREPESTIAEPPVATSGSRSAPRIQGELHAVSVAGLDGADPPVLQRRDLRVHVEARLAEGVTANVGLLIERADGVWVSGVGTHVDGVTLTRDDDGRIAVDLVFDDLALLSGEYVISVYLFDATGLVVFEEWLKYRRFRVVQVSQEMGLVSLPHRWEQAAS